MRLNRYGTGSPCVKDFTFLKIFQTFKFHGNYISIATREAMSNNKSRSNDNTIFVRGLPTDVVRHELEELFSDIGPVKKCSVIKSKAPQDTTSSSSNSCLGFGFVKFTSPGDAEMAVKRLNKVTTERGGQSFTLQVELASAAKGQKEKETRAKSKSKSEPAAAAATTGTATTTTATTTTTTTTSNEPKSQKELAAAAALYEQNSKKKRTSKVIIRNLSFYAKESHIRASMAVFGEIAEVNLPTVKIDDEAHANANAKTKPSPAQASLQHRGFAFVTFEKASSATKAIAASGKEEGLKIKNRSVAVDFSVSKMQHNEMKREEKGGDSGNSASSDSGSDSDSSDSSDSGRESDSDSDSEKDDNKKNEKKKNDNSNTPSNSPKSPKFNNKNDIEGGLSLFVRNIPFDADKQQLFDVFVKFGRIDSVYLVKDPVTMVNKGTAFVKYAYKAACDRAVDAGAAGKDLDFVNAKNAFSDSMIDGEGVTLNGRRLLVDRAVDRGTAATLKEERDSDGKVVKRGKDKRNMYLRLAGTVSSSEAIEKVSEPASETSLVDTASERILSVAARFARYFCGHGCLATVPTNISLHFICAAAEARRRKEGEGHE